MDTYFAPAERTEKDRLAAEIEFVSRNSVVSGLLHTISGLLAVLDEHRQIIGLNDSFLRMLGIDDPSKALGLRLGEAVQCVHAYEEPAGCGTTRLCSTCGAAIAIVTSLGQDQPVERTCALTARSNGSTIDLALRVKSHPIKIDRERFLLLFLQDITRQQQRAALERAFFHDVNNMLNMIVGASELLVKSAPSELSQDVHQAALRLMKEIDIQRCLSQSDSGDYKTTFQVVTTRQIFSNIQAFFTNHPAARNKTLELQKDYPRVSVTTDFSLLSRVLCNMILNALEATDDNGVVKFRVEREGDRISFCVWNAREIPQEIALRIFQRHFSTKEQAGRGIGTYSMKMFGEKILGGKVSFTTSEKNGTTFRFTCPA